MNASNLLRRVPAGNLECPEAQMPSIDLLQSSPLDGFCLRLGLRLKDPLPTLQMTTGNAQDTAGAPQKSYDYDNPSRRDSDLLEAMASGGWDLPPTPR